MRKPMGPSIFLRQIFLLEGFFALYFFSLLGFNIALL